MGNSVCPCKCCVAPVRHEGCHTDCQLYVSWKAQHDRYREKIIKEMEIENDFNSYRTDNHQKYERKKRNRSGR